MNIVSKSVLSCLIPSKTISSFTNTEKLIQEQLVDGNRPVSVYEPQVILLSELNPEAITNMLSFMGRLSWESDWKKDPERFISSIIKRGHESVLEHSFFSFLILCSRATSHEIVRHRIGISFTQTSQRYVSYATEEPLPICLPPLCTPDEEYLIVDASITASSEYKMAVNYSSIQKEIAREILPNATATLVGMSVNVRSLRHFLELRMNKDAYPPIRSIANQIYEIIRDAKLGYLVSDYENLRQYDPRNQDTQQNNT